MRTAVEERGVPRRDWSDLAIVIGACLLAAAIMVTLVLALAINARANRLVAGEAIRATTSAETVTRLEGKLDGLIDELHSHVLTTTTATTATPAPPTTRQTSARRSKATPTATTLGRAPTTRPAPPTTRPAPQTTLRTVPPCALALLDTCLLR